MNTSKPFSTTSTSSSTPWVPLEQREIGEQGKRNSRVETRNLWRREEELVGELGWGAVVLVITQSAKDTEFWSKHCKLLNLVHCSRSSTRSALILLSDSRTKISWNLCPFHSVLVIIAFPRRENRPEAQEAADCATSCPQHGDSDSLRPSTNTSIHLADQRDRLHRARSTPPLSSSPSTPNSHFLRRDPQCISNLIFRQ